MEYFDLIDENGNPTGKTKSRPDAHRDGDWHRTVHAWIFNSKHELLIQKRAPNLKAHPGMWHISVAGHISAGENSLGTVSKEISEELGINIDPKKIEYLFSLKHQCVLDNGKYVSNHWNDVYLIPMDLDVTKARLQAEEVSEIKFVNYKKLEVMIKNKSIDFVEHNEEYDQLFKLLNKRYG